MKGLILVFILGLLILGLLWKTFDRQNEDREGNGVEPEALVESLTNRQRTGETNPQKSGNPRRSAKIFTSQYMADQSRHRFFHETPPDNPKRRETHFILWVLDDEASAMEWLAQQAPSPDRDNLARWGASAVFDSGHRTTARTYLGLISDEEKRERLRLSFDTLEEMHLKDSLN
ncbi:MAG: hypothetical protein AAF357_19825 [Verrucomicrobiota bacterium]